MTNPDYKSGDPFIMKGEGVPVESLNHFIMTGGLFIGHGTVTVPTNFHEGIWSALETPQKARFSKFTLNNMTGTNNGNNLSFTTSQGCVIRADLFMQMMDKIEKIQFAGTGLAGLSVKVLKHYPSMGAGDVLINSLDLADPVVNIPVANLDSDAFYLELSCTSGPVTVNTVAVTVKTSKFGEGEDVGLNSDNVVNNSSVTGVKTTDALNVLKNQINNLDSDKIVNKSSVTGSKETDALNTLKGIVDTLTSQMETRKLPVGFVMSTTGSTNPATLLGYGTWERYAQGRVLVGEGGGFAAGETGGNKEITLSVNQLPSHNHSVAVTSSGSATTGEKTGLTTASDGGGTSGSSSPSTNSTGSHSHTINYYKSLSQGTSGWNIHFSGTDGATGTNNAGSHSHTVNSHTHTTPSHSHAVNDHSHTTPNHTHSISEDNVGSAAPVNIMPPYVVVYMWRRTA